MEDQDPVEGGVGWVGEWGSATERLEGQGLPGPSSLPLTLWEKIMDEEGPEVPVPLFPNIADKTFRRICYKKPNYWHLSVFWANRPAATVNNETTQRCVV